MFCPACRRELVSDVRFCGYCGQNLLSSEPILLTSQRRQWPADSRIAVPRATPQARVAVPVELIVPVELPAVLLRARQVEPLPSLRDVPAMVGFRRLPYEIFVGVHSPHNFYRGLDMGVELVGLFVATYAPAEIDELVEIAFRLGQMRCLTRCQVEWVREYTDQTREALPGMGVRFLGFKPEIARAIERFLGVREPLFYEGDHTAPFAVKVRPVRR